MNKNRILCKGGCPLGESAKYCKYCLSGACEADKPKQPTPPPYNPTKYVSYGGILVRRNGK